MTTRQSMRWLEKTLKHIPYPPDRKRVSNELYDHIMQRIALFSSEGYSDNEADRRTAEAMGDPDEVGKALSRECRPFWGWTLLTLRVVVLILTIVFAVTLVKNLPGILRNQELLRGARETADDIPWVEQFSEAECGDYRFRLRNAKLVPQEDGSTRLMLELSAFTWDPMLGSPDCVRFLTVTDSVGNVYAASGSLNPLTGVGPSVRSHRIGMVTYSLGSGISQENIFTWKGFICADGFDEAAEWAVLSFDNGERQFSLPIRLEDRG